MEPAQLVLAGAPLAVLSLALFLFSLRDLVVRPSNAVTGGSKLVWGLVMLIATAGPILYLWAGRKEPPVRRE